MAVPADNGVAARGDGRGARCEHHGSFKALSCGDPEDDGCRPFWREDLLQLVEQAAQRRVLDLLPLYQALGHAPGTRMTILGCAARNRASRGSLIPVRDEPERGAVAGHHCIACQCARIFLPSSSGVGPVSTSPALPIADQVP